MVEGALLAAITAVMGALAIHLIPVKFLVDFIWGIPLILIVKRHNLRIGLLTMAVTFVITWFLAGPLMTLLLLVELAPLAMIYALFIKKNSAPGTTLAAGIVISIISAVVTILGYYYLAGITLVPTELAVRAQIGQIMDMYQKLGIDPGQSEILAENVIRMAVVLVPMTIAVASVIRALLTYTLAVGVLRRLGHPVRSLPRFTSWRLPWYSVWPFIIGLLMSLLGDYFKVQIVAAIGKNLILLLAPLFFILGVAVSAYFLNSWHIPRWAKILIFVVAFLNLDGTIVLIALLGIFDPLVSFRLWRRRPKE